ncbi:hypothetical protein WJX84_004216, partial [Apatococcus fuscideae]
SMQGTDISDELANLANSSPALLTFYASELAREGTDIGISDVVGNADFKITRMIYADLLPVLNKIPQEQRRALYDMSCPLTGSQCQRIANPALLRVLHGLTAPILEGSERIYLTSSIYRQAFKASPSHIIA